MDNTPVKKLWHKESRKQLPPNEILLRKELIEARQQLNTKTLDQLNCLHGTTKRKEFFKQFPLIIDGQLRMNLIKLAIDDKNKEIAKEMRLAREESEKNALAILAEKSLDELNEIMETREQYFAQFPLIVDDLTKAGIIQIAIDYRKKEIKIACKKSRKDAQEMLNGKSLNELNEIANTRTQFFSQFPLIVTEKMKLKILKKAFTLARQNIRLCNTFSNPIFMEAFIKVMSLREIMHLSLVSTLFRSSIIHIQNKLFSYKQKFALTQIVSDLITFGGFQFDGIETLLNTDIDNIVKLDNPTKMLCQQCPRQFIMDEVYIKKEKMLCADCQGGKQISHTKGCSHSAKRYIDCNVCNAQFYLKRDYNGRYAKCQICRLVDFR